MKQTEKILYTFLFASLILISGCGKKAAGPTPADSGTTTLSPRAESTLPDVSTGLFSYTDQKREFTYQEHTVPLTSLFTAESLKNQNYECPVKQSYDYFVNVFHQFKDTDTAQQFTFGSWKVTVVPNRLHYKTLDDFKKDFAVCSTVGDLLPTLVSNSSLLFISPCPNGSNGQVTADCVKTRDKLLPTLKLK